MPCGATAYPRLLGTRESSRQGWGSVASCPRRGSGWRPKPPGVSLAVRGETSPEAETGTRRTLEASASSALTADHDLEIVCVAVELAGMVVYALHYPSGCYPQGVELLARLGRTERSRDLKPALGEAHEDAGADKIAVAGRGTSP